MGYNSIKDILANKKTNYFMEAYNPISAKIVEEAKFDGVWISSLTMSASMGKRDCNELSWKEILDISSNMRECVELPILLDADTGYGNYNNARIIANKFYKIGVDALCLEDKLFPKQNSFINSNNQKLCDIREMCAKIQAIKDLNSGVSVVARTESCIVGEGVSEAIRRAEKYWLAGADAIFIHSKKSEPTEIIEFMNEWKDTCPVIIAPTTYSTEDSSVFEELGIRIVIWANIMLRASVTEMQRIAKKVKESKSIIFDKNEIVSVKEIFRLQNMDELQFTESKYNKKEI